MNGVFADTSFYVAFVSPDDRWDHRAVLLAREHTRRIVATEQVLTEAGNWFARTGDRRVFLDLLESIRGDPKTTVVWSDRPLFDEGLRLYAGRRYKEWSLTDCISFVVMNRYGLTEAFTIDHHFEQAGFTALLR